MSLGEITGVVLRLFTHRTELEQLWPRIRLAQRSAQEILATVDATMALANKIAPGLLGDVRAVEPEQRYDVAWLQQSLNTLVGAGLAVDGELGPLTKRAIEVFQRQNGLVVDGWAGVATEAKILDRLYSTTRRA